MHAPIEEHITWLASYPKSGNTWVRALLEAYRQNGYIDINDIRTGVGDTSHAWMNMASPVPHDDLGPRGQVLVRPVALMHAMVSMKSPRFFKTHFANVQLDRLPPFIPPDITERAVYIVRDPRAVAVSFSKHFGVDQEETVRVMGDEQADVGGERQHKQFLSSWSRHVQSWVNEKTFKVLVVRYEELSANPVAMLGAILEFCGLEVDAERVQRAVDACHISRLQGAEEEHGFLEADLYGLPKKFFNAGGQRWHDEFGAKWVRLIEAEHADTMAALGYSIDEE